MVLADSLLNLDAKTKCNARYGWHGTKPGCVRGKSSKGYKSAIGPKPAAQKSIQSSLLKSRTVNGAARDRLNAASALIGGSKRLSSSQIDEVMNYLEYSKGSKLQGEAKAIRDTAVRRASGADTKRLKAMSFTGKSQPKKAKKDDVKGKLADGRPDSSYSVQQRLVNQGIERFAKGSQIKTTGKLASVTRSIQRAMGRDLVPIAALRDAMSNRVRAQDFDDFVRGLSSEGFKLIGGEAAPEKYYSTSQLKNGGIETSLGGQRFYIQKDEDY